ncbi:MAG TPA: tectonin domain-containing protein [Candidatus Sulfomarinibacteraceae bacterium]|nr:tectonin domain-containing protein [Candidatus Sulfomarinibacteraceae bacterium]
MAHVRSVSVGSDGTMWARDQLGLLYKRDGNQWRRNPTAIAEEVVVADANNVWCRNKNGELFKLQSSDWNAGWDKNTVGRDVVSLHVTTDGCVRVVNNKGEIWERREDGATAEEGRWKKVDGPPNLPGAQDRLYQVQPGDGLRKVVKREYNLTDEREIKRRIDQIVARNDNVPNADTIKAHDWIVLPA